MEFAAAVIGFIFFVANAILGLLLLVIFISALLSWMFALDVLNHRNRFVSQLAYALDRITAPVLAPLRRFIPPLGGIDITPVVAWILISGVQGILLPAAERAALGALGY